MTPDRNGARATTPLGTPTRVIAFEFYDVPLEGVIEFGDGGRGFRFRLSDRDGAVTRSGGAVEYTLSPLPPGALDRIVGVLSPYLTPTWPVWVPIWRFPSPEVEEGVSAAVDAVLAEAGAEQSRVVLDLCAAFEDHDAPAA